MNTIKFEKKDRRDYASPSMDCVELASEQVFATSGITEQDYEWSELSEFEWL